MFVGWGLLVRFGCLDSGVCLRVVIVTVELCVCGFACRFVRWFGFGVVRWLDLWGIVFVCVWVSCGLFV